MTQPVVDQAQSLFFERGLDAAAAIMADHHDVTHLEYVDGELHHRQAVEIGVHHHVADIAMDEDFAGHEAGDFVGRHARVGTADPQIFRRLQVGQLAEELAVAGAHGIGPNPVVLKQVAEVIAMLTHFPNSPLSLSLRPSCSFC